MSNYDLDPPELDDAENPLLWPDPFTETEPLPTDEEADAAEPHELDDLAATVDENIARNRVLLACDEVCRVAGLDPRNVAAWGELKGELLAAVERHGITGTDAGYYAVPRLDLDDEDADPYRVEEPFYDADPPDDDPGVMGALRAYHERKDARRR